VIKAKTTGQRIFVNGEWKAGSGEMGNYTVYVNPYVVLNSGGYTKHYYIEDQRIVSKLGGGWDGNGQGSLKAGNGKVDYAARHQKVFDGIVKNLKFLGADGQILTAGKSGKVPPGQVNGTGNLSEAFRYFFHPDHLGSTSYVTDASGEVFQHLEYMAFGETFVEEHSNTDRTPYLFSGKELDEETGLYYFNSRYQDPRSSAWLSVDPLAEKYQGISAYAYCANNPLKNKEIDGRYFVGTDGRPVTVTVRQDGSITLGRNASSDLRRMANLVTASKSETALGQFTKLANNQTRVNFKIVTERVNNRLLGLHQAHDSQGPIKWRAGTDGTGTFERMPEYIQGANGNAYKEASITIFEGNFTQDQIDAQRFLSDDNGLTKDEMLVATFAHEGYHDTDQRTIDAIKKRQEGRTDNFDVETAAENNAENKVYREVKNRRQQRD
jgi:RHS repeat-associated protein